MKNGLDMLTTDHDSIFNAEFSKAVMICNYWIGRMNGESINSYINVQKSVESHTWVLIKKDSSTNIYTH